MMQNFEQNLNPNNSQKSLQEAFNELKSKVNQTSLEEEIFQNLNAVQIMLAREFYPEAETDEERFEKWITSEDSGRFRKLLDDYPEIKSRAEIGDMSVLEEISKKLSH
jgi:hypothetical protein